MSVIEHEFSPGPTSGRCIAGVGGLEICGRWPHEHEKLAAPLFKHCRHCGVAVVRIALADTTHPERPVTNELYHVAVGHAYRACHPHQTYAEVDEMDD